MPPIRNTTEEERDAIFKALNYVQDQLKERPTVKSISKHAKLPPRQAQLVISKMVREGHLHTNIYGREEFIYASPIK